MKKKILSLIMIGCMVIGMVGCGSSTQTQSQTDSQIQETTSSTTDGGTVKIICGYGAGGTADAIARKYAKVAKQLFPEYNFVVENMTGGDGFAAATYYSELDANTKELLVYGYGLAYRHDIGKQYGTEEVDFDRSAIKPIATIDDRTWILYTTPDKTLEDIIELSKNGGIKMSGGNPLSDPHLALGSLIAQLDGNVMVVPYDGGAAQIKGLTDGEVDVFVGTTQAGQESVEAGTIVPVLAFLDEAFEGFVTPEGAITVPTVVGDAKASELPESIDFSGSILKAGGFIATRTGGDQEWADKVEEISRAVWGDAEYSEWIEEILLNVHEVYGADAEALLDEACEKAILAYETLK